VKNANDQVLTTTQSSSAAHAITTSVASAGSQRSHKKNKLGPGGLPHDKVNPRVVEDLKACLAAPATEAEEKEAHLEDEDTTWFGVTKDPDKGSYEFQDRGRYASIMARSMGMSNEKRFPKIVSFIGDTGMTSHSSP
jgi:hypothetical protein